MSQIETLERLQQVQAAIARLTGQLEQLEAARDSLIQQLSDSDGCHDRRPVGVR